MKRSLWMMVGLLAACGWLAGPAVAAQLELQHLAAYDLGLYFNSTSGYGQNPLSVAFDGTNAYVGGFNSTTAAANIGVVKVENVVGGSPTYTPLANTVFSSPASRGLDALAYNAGAGALIMCPDSGSATTSFISRRNAGDGSTVWSIANPQSARPMAMAVDPRGDNGGAGVAFLVQGSGRRRLLSMATGATVFDGGNGGIINTSPDSGTTWRGMAFDDLGNIVVGNQSAYGYGVRNTDNQWKTLAGALNLTTRSVLKNVTVNNVGQGVAILEDLGSDLIAFSGRNMTTLTDSLGGVTTVDNKMVHIRNLDGSTTGLTQIALAGNENGIGTPWADNLKNLAFGLDASGKATLLVLDYTGRRLDVYQIPEPTTLALFALVGLVLRRR